MTQARTATPEGQIVRYRGRAWFAALLWLLGLICWAEAVGSIFLGWFGMLDLGLVCLIAGHTCFTFGWGEAVACVELRNDGFALRLPRYRGYFPFWPIQRLSGAWTDVVALRRTPVGARILWIRFDYVMHTIITKRGRIMLFEPLANDFFRNTRGTGLNLPAGDIADAFARRSRVAPTDCGQVWGGGLWRNLVFGGPDVLRHPGSPPAAASEEGQS